MGYVPKLSVDQLTITELKTGYKTLVDMLVKGRWRQFPVLLSDTFSLGIIRKLEYKVKYKDLRVFPLPKTLLMEAICEKRYKEAKKMLDTDVGILYDTVHDPCMYAIKCNNWQIFLYIVKTHYKQRVYKFSIPPTYALLTYIEMHEAGEFKNWLIQLFKCVVRDCIEFINDKDETDSRLLSYVIEMLPELTSYIRLLGGTK